MTYNEVVKYLEKEIKDRKLGYEYFLGQGHYPDEDKLKNIANIQAVLDFINRQNAEVERLADRNHKCIYLSDDETTEFCVDGPCPKFKTEKQIRAEAIKEFAERVKKAMRTGALQRDKTNRAIIDNIVKEMTEEGAE